MWVLVILGFCAVYPAHTTRLHQDLGPIHLHGKLGNIPEIPLDHSDLYSSKLVTQYVGENLHKIDPLKIAKIERIDVNLPELKFAGRFHLTNLVVTGLSYLILPDLKIRKGINRLDFNASYPHLYVEVDVLLSTTLDEKFHNNKFVTTTRLRFNLQDVNISAAFHFSPKLEKFYFIDNAEVDVDIKDAQVLINVIVGLEELRYLLADFFNKPLDRIADAILREVISAINKVLTKFTIKQVDEYLSSTAPTQPPSSLRTLYYPAKQLRNIATLDRRDLMGRYY